MAKKPAPQNLAALADLLIKVPSAQREAARASTELLLRELGFDPAEHQYLFGTRFRDLVPELRQAKVPQQRNYHFELSDGSAKERRTGPAWAEGYTSLNELMSFLGRTEAMVRRYLRDPLYRDRDGVIYINHRRSPGGLIRLWDTRGLEAPDSALNLFEAVKLWPDPLGSLGRRSRY